MTIKVKCKAPEGDTGKSYKVWNGRSYSYLAKSQMNDVTIAGDVMTFTTSTWFREKIHPWLEITETVNP